MATSRSCCRSWAQVDVGHAAAADLAIDLVAGRERDPQPLHLFHYGGTHGAPLAAGRRPAGPWMGDQFILGSPP